LLSLAGVIFLFAQKPKLRSPYWFAAILTVFGVLYAAATPLSQAFYFGVPGLAQMGGVGRALLLWSFGAAVLAAFGLDAMRRRWSTPIIPAVAILFVAGELFFNSSVVHRIAPRASVYPQTQLTTWLQERAKDGGRVLFITPRESWLPSEAFNTSLARSHPAGVLPPNGAMVYGINDVSGYDSLAPRAYREFVAPGENLKPGEDISPALNGNMILLQNPNSPALEQLGLRYVVSQAPLDVVGWKEVLRTDGCIVYERAKRGGQPEANSTVKRGASKSGIAKSGEDFNPGWRDGKYQPESFRFGSFVSLCALAFCALCIALRVTKIR
jgi:hypothetical protein